MGIDAGFAIRSYFTGFAGVEMIFLQYGARQGNAYGSAGKAPGPGKIVAQLRRMGNPISVTTLSRLQYLESVRNERTVSQSLR